MSTRTLRRNRRLKIVVILLVIAVVVGLAGIALAPTITVAGLSFIG